MPLRFNNIDLIPAPLVTINRNAIRGPNAIIQGYNYNIVLTGWLLNVGSSLDSPATTANSLPTPPLTGDQGWSLNGIMNQERYIRDIFSVESGRLEIEAPGGGGSGTTDLYCFVDNIVFEKSVWVNLISYSVTLHSKTIEGSGDINTGLETFSESWNVVENEDNTYNISHSVSAKGYLDYSFGLTNNPLIAASGWCVSRLYITDTSGNFNPLISSNIPGSGITFNLNNLIQKPGSITNNYWNKVTTQTCNPQDYSYSATENFVYNPTGNAREIWSASVNYEQDNLRRANIGLNGTIFGYSDKLSNLTQRNLNASGYYFGSVDPNIYLRALSYAPSGFTVSTQPLSKQVTFQRPNGLINYTYNFSASNGTLIPGAIEENININDVGSNDVFAQIGIPGRANGPLIQSMQTTTAPERSITINATLIPDLTPISSGSLLSMYLSKPNTDQLIAILRPNTGNFYVRQDHEEYNPIRKQYSRSVNWVMASSGVLGLPHAIRNPALN